MRISRFERLVRVLWLIQEGGTEAINRADFYSIARSEQVGEYEASRIKQYLVTLESRGWLVPEGQGIYTLNIPKRTL